MLARVHRRPPPSANGANTIWVNIGERSRTGVNETETETRARRPTTGQHGRGATPGKRRGDLVGAEPGFGLARPSQPPGPDGTRQSCYAVGLHPYQFICAIALPRSPTVKSFTLPMAMNRTERRFRAASDQPSACRWRAPNHPFWMRCEVRSPRASPTPDVSSRRTAGRACSVKSCTSAWASAVGLQPVWMSGSWLVMPRRTCPAYPSWAAGAKEELRLAARRASWCVPQRRHQLALGQVAVTKVKVTSQQQVARDPGSTCWPSAAAPAARQARPAGSATLP
jgi:hypothetical protein